MTDNCVSYLMAHRFCELRQLKCERDEGGKPKDFAKCTFFARHFSLSGKYFGDFRKTFREKRKH
jgi:hypothetical protein